jgi:hypothetical protein
MVARREERACGKQTGGKASTHKPIVLAMKAGSNVLYSLSLFYW